MTFFDQLKQMKQIKDIQDQLSKERMEAEKEGIKAVVNGKMEVEEIVLNPSLAKEQQERLVKECVNEAMKKVQMSAAQKFMQSQN
jgi:DNA-binding protein YbaB